MRILEYKTLNINQKINIKGHDEADDKLFKYTGRMPRILRMYFSHTHWPERIANQLFTFDELYKYHYIL